MGMELAGPSVGLEEPPLLGLQRGSQAISVDPVPLLLSPPAHRAWPQSTTGQIATVPVPEPLD